jgi:hypothetical protein
MTEKPQYFETSDETRAKMLAGVNAFERELGRSARANEDGLTASWTALVKLLAITPPAQTRACPGCGAVGMRAATRCHTCWNALVPLADVSAAPSVAGGLSDF